VFRSDQEWGKSDRGVQMFGTCHEARGPGREKAERLYARRFPLYARWMHGRTKEARAMAAGLRSYAFYRFLPRTVKILDERVFGGAVFVVADVGRRRPHG